MDGGAGLTAWLGKVAEPLTVEETDPLGLILLLPEMLGD